MEENISRAVLDTVAEIEQEQRKIREAVFLHIIAVHLTVLILVVLFSVDGISELVLTNATWATAVLAVLNHTVIHLKVRN